MSHIIFFNTKGGVGKSTLCEFAARELARTGRTVAVENTDQQKHVTLIINEEAEFNLYDTAGAFTTQNMELLSAAAEADAVIIIPLNTGINDLKELDFLISKLEKHKIKHKSFFLFTRARINSKSLKLRRETLRNKGLNVCKYVMPSLEDFSEQRDTSRTRNEISQFLNEVIML